MRGRCFGVLPATAALALPLALIWLPAGQLPGPGAGQASSKIAGQVLRDTAGGGTASFVVLLSQQADLSGARKIGDQSLRGRQVVDLLRGSAARSQPPLRSLLDARGVKHTDFWVANSIVVTGDRSLAETLAARPDVRAIESNDPIPATRTIEPPDVANYQPSAGGRIPDAVEWGVANVNAPDVWALGYNGQGIVVGNADTGMKWDHPALIGHYRGWDGTNVDHNYNWHDSIHDSVGNPCGNDSPFPCDDNRHGTHTTGTAVGDDGAGNQIGVAPGAQWIGCRNMDRGNGTPDRYTECFQWFIAPTDSNGQNPNPDLRPHVINNSWGCPPSEGCAPLTLQQVVEDTEAAGIFVEVSAGNSGPQCSTVVDPPALYDASFSTGAYSITNVLASFSSRGPVTIDGSGRLKPNISGPGVNVRSSVIPSGYGNLSGTSMAGPHVVGTVALLWSARPEFSRDIETTKLILESTANPNLTVTPAQTCGGTSSTDIPNNSFGFGRVDALAAVNYSGGFRDRPPHTT